MRGQCVYCDAWCATRESRKGLGDLIRPAYRVGWCIQDRMFCDPCVMKLIYQALGLDKQSDKAA